MRTVLVVDDEPQLRQLYRDTLEAEGYRVVEAEGAATALERLGAPGADLAILDIRMPGIHGLELLSRIHTIRPDLPVIICSALPGLFDDYALWEARQQVVATLAKPVDIDVLIRCVGRAVEAPCPPS